MRDDKPVTFNLQNAPLIVGLSALAANSKLELDWPQKISYANLKLSKKLPEELEEKLSWVKRQCEVLLMNPKTKAFAPHVLPYLTQANMHISAARTAFAAEADVLGAYPLEYTSNLAKSLNSAFGEVKKPRRNSNTTTEDKPAIEDRTRFRIIKTEPVNELEAGFNAYYAKSGLSYAGAYESWLELGYDDKQKQLITALGANKAEVSYKMEVVLEPQLLLDGLSVGFFSINAIQAPSPVHGYSLPKNLADGGMIERCFDISYELYSELSKKHSSAAPLVCLWGHRQRAIIEIKLSGLANMTGAKTGRLKRLADTLLEKLTEKHPIVVEEVRATVK